MLDYISCFDETNSFRKMLHIVENMIVCGDVGIWIPPIEVEVPMLKKMMIIH